MEKEARPPKQIWYSLYAFLGTIVVVLGFFVLSALRYGIKLHRSDIEVSLLESAIIVFLMLLLFRRKKWARTVYAILTSLLVLSVFVAMLGALVGFGPMKEVLSLGVYNLMALSLQVFLRLLSVYFLYARQSREWFKVPIAENNAAPGGTEESTHVSNLFSHDGVKSVAVPLHTTSLQAPPSVRETTVATPSRWRQVGMKKRALLAGGLVLSISLVIVFVHNGRRATKVEAIRSALIADVRLSRQISGNRPMLESDAKVIQAYAQGLRRIDMSRCPRDFQMAYLEHIQAWESLARSRASVDLLRPLFELFVLRKIPNLPDSPDEQQIRGEIAKTWDRTERTALSYGVRAPE